MKKLCGINLSDFTLKVASEESVAQLRGRDEFRRLCKEHFGITLADARHGDRYMVTFSENPLAVALDDARVYATKNGLHFEGLGLDSMKIAVRIFFDEYAQRENITPSRFTVDSYMKRHKIDKVEYLNSDAPSFMEANPINVTRIADGEVFVHWQNHTVYPDETVNMLGVNFEADSEIELFRISDESGDDAVLEDKRTVKPIIVTNDNIMFIIPKDMEMGIFRARVKNSFGYSNPVDINAPDVWWYMGDEGERASEGGELQLMGNALSFDTAKIMLLSERGRARIITPYFHDGYCLRARLPKKATAGEYKIYVNNGYGGNSGWVYHDKLTVAKSVRSYDATVEFDHTPNDCFKELQSAMYDLERLGGGTLLLADGIYTVDGALTIPKNVRLMCKNRNSAVLHTYERIDMRSFAIMENVSIICHRSEIGELVLVTGEGVRMLNVYVGSAPEYERTVTGADCVLYAVYAEAASNFVIDGCEIYSHRLGVLFAGICKWSVIRNSTIKAPNGSVFIRASHRIVIENNYLTTVHVRGSAVIAPQMSGVGCYMTYLAYNRIVFTMFNDREAITYDDHGTLYYGKAVFSGNHMTCLDPTQIVDNHYWFCYDKKNIRNYMAFAKNDRFEWHGLAVFIVSGKGLGQHRNVIIEGGRSLNIDTPWDIEPDDSSRFVVSAFNGRHIITDNYFCETGVAAQTFPPNSDAIIARNYSDECGGGIAVGARFITKTEPDGRVLFCAEPNMRTSVVDNVLVQGSNGLSFRCVTNIGLGATDCYGAGDGTRMLFAATVKRNSTHTGGCFANQGLTDMTVMEKNYSANTLRAFDIGRTKFPERWDKTGFPTNYVIRDNSVYNAQIEYNFWKNESDKVGELK